MKYIGYFIWSERGYLVQVRYKWIFKNRSEDSIGPDFFYVPVLRPKLKCWEINSLLTHWPVMTCRYSDISAYLLSRQQTAARLQCPLSPWELTTAGAQVNVSFGGKKKKQTHFLQIHSFVWFVLKYLQYWETTHSVLSFNSITDVEEC